MIPFSEQKKLGLASFYHNLANKVLTITDVNMTGIYRDKQVQLLYFDEDEGGIYAMRFKSFYDLEEFE